MTALAIRDDQEQFDEFQVAVLRQSGVDEDVTNAELAAFLHTCQRRQLDPFAQQIYLIGRYDRMKGRKVYKPQTSIDGFRLIARRAADRSNIDYEYEDTVWFDSDGRRYEVWLSDKPPAAAKVVVVRNGRRFDAVARYAAYVQTGRDNNPSGQWRNMADTMIAKCAESLALRKAFPEDLGGLYTAEEMGQADNTAADPPPTQAQAERPDNRAKRSTQPATDEEWFEGIKTRVRAIASREDGNNLWREINAKRDAGQCAADDVKELRQFIATQVEIVEAAAASEATQEQPDDALEGQVVNSHVEAGAA